MSDQEQALLDEERELEAQREAMEADPGTVDPPGQSQIPEKFKGKDIDDVFTSYRALEQEKGRISSELGQARQKSEDYEKRIEALEAQLRQPVHPQYQQPQPVATQPQPDPLENFEDEFNEDPGRAFAKYVKYSEKKRQEELEAVKRDFKANTATDYYYKQKAENPDFERREAKMTELVQRYGHLFADLQSKEAMEFFDLASQGADRQYYEDQAVAKLKGKKEEVLNEKRSAHSESPHTEGEQVVNFENLSLEEMEKLLPKTENY